MTHTQQFHVLHIHEMTSSFSQLVGTNLQGQEAFPLQSRRDQLWSHLNFMYEVPRAQFSRTRGTEFEAYHSPPPRPSSRLSEWALLIYVLFAFAFMNCSAMCQYNAICKKENLFKNLLFLSKRQASIIC